MSLYRHDFSNRPMSEARRQAVHGPIEPAYNPHKDLGWGMVCIVAVLALVLVFAAMTP